MPTYQYRCTACAEDLEAVQSFTDAALTDCPACGGSLRKVFGSVGVVFKGSGFYKTDSRSSGKSGTSTSKAGQTTSESTSSSSSSDSSSSGSGDKAAASTTTSSGSASSTSPNSAASAA